MMFATIRVFAGGLLCLITAAASAFCANVQAVQLRDLCPTQAVVGFDEIYWKLERFSDNPKKMFDAFCEFNGQSGVLHFSSSSVIRDEQSFLCEEPVGAHPDAMGTAVIAPDGKFYLTDGHHKSQEFWHAPGGGPDVTLHVVVEHDYRALPSMEVFWERLKFENGVWLFDATDHPIVPDELPTSFGLEHFQNDPYRSMMYFIDHIAWEKPEPAVPFVEFYWTREIRKKVDLSSYDLMTVDGYLDALRQVGAVMSELQSSNIGGSHKTAEQMGQRYVSDKKLKKAVLELKSEIKKMLRYKQTLSATK